MSDIICKDCLHPRDNGCVCAMVDSFMNDNKHLMDRLKEMEDAEKKRQQKKSCLACFFNPCQCKSGHSERLKKL